MPRTVTNARQRHFHSSASCDSADTARDIALSNDTFSRLFQLPLSPPPSSPPRRARNVTSISSSGPNSLSSLLSYSRSTAVVFSSLFFHLTEILSQNDDERKARTRREERSWRDRREGRRRRNGERSGEWGWLGRRVYGDRARGRGRGHDDRGADGGSRGGRR